MRLRIGGESNTETIFDLLEWFAIRRWSFLLERLRNEIVYHLQCVGAEKPWPADWENHTLDSGSLIRNGSEMTRESTCNVTLQNSERRLANEACKQERNSGAEGHEALEVRMRQDRQ
jgi:hypothetical protein